jgi:hypothetical protein
MRGPAAASTALKAQDGKAMRPLTDRREVVDRPPAALVRKRRLPAGGRRRGRGRRDLLHGRGGAGGGRMGEAGGGPGGFVRRIGGAGVVWLGWGRRLPIAVWAGGASGEQRAALPSATAAISGRHLSSISDDLKYVWEIDRDRVAGQALDRPGMNLPGEERSPGWLLSSQLPQWLQPCMRYNNRASMIYRCR